MSISNNFIVIVGYDKFLSKLDDEHKNTFFEVLKNQKEILKITFALIDIPSAFKKYEYDEWYKECVNGNDGLWIGSGVTNQYTVKLSIQPNKINTIENEYAIVVKNGMPTIAKIVNEIK